MLFILYLLGVLILFVAPLLGFVAFLRTRRLDELERKLARLEARVGQLSSAPSESPMAARSEAPERAEWPISAAPPVAPALVGAELPPKPELPPIATAPRARRARVRIDWERWIGVRGAALVGGIAFAIAGILFFKHAFERGWITPESRVLTGGVVGLVAIGFAELLRPRGYRFAPQALAAAGIVILYASTWAAHRLYALVSFAGAFPITAAITIGCAWIAIRQRSLIVAVLGLVGGFMTPLVLESAEPSALRWFGYVLLLDLGLLGVAARMRRPLLSLLGVAGTFLLELVWVRQHLEPDGLPVVLATLGLFALLFALFGARGVNANARASFGAQAAAILVPFAFVVHFALHAEFGPSLWPLATLAAVLAAAACAVAAARRAPWLAEGAASASVALPIVWAFARGDEQPLAGAVVWELGLSLLGIALVVQLAFAWAHRRARNVATSTRPVAPVGASLLALAGMCAVAFRELDGPSAPWLASFAALASLLHLQGRWYEPWSLRPCAALGAALGLAVLLRAQRELAGSAEALHIGVLWVAPALALLLAARFEPGRVGAGARKGAWVAALAFALAGLASSTTLPAQLDGEPWPVLGTLLALVAIGALASNALASGAGFAALVVAACAAFDSWLRHASARPDSLGGDALPVWLGLAGAFLLAAWPLAFRRWNARKALAWRAAALAPLFLFAPLLELARERIGAGAELVLSLGCAAGLAAACAGIARRRPVEARELRARRTALAHFAGVSVFFAALALPLHVGRYEPVVAAALAGLGWSAVWRRLDHAGIKCWAVAALAFAAVTALMSATSSGHYPSSTSILWSWTSFGVLLPAAALFASAALMRGREVERARSLEREVYRGGKPIVSSAFGLLGALCLFAWINLAILDVYETGDVIRVAWERAPARDLTQSIAWVVYALALLAIGMARRAVGVRWLSLVFLLLALGKVFLHDLGELEGLYRVASFLGLGLSLIVVSLAYQRFVFGRDVEPPTLDTNDADAAAERA